MLHVESCATGGLRDTTTNSLIAANEY